ncbi:MAG: hypothetical protein J6X55_04495 [Victivallales bacterium]|nr:hypothetical protein [Victivallales bacterium]
MKNHPRLSIFCFLTLALSLLTAGDIHEISLFPIDFQYGKISFNEGHLAPILIKFQGNTGNLASAQKTELVVTHPEGLELKAAHSIHPSDATSFTVTNEKGVSRVWLTRKYCGRWIHPSRYFWNCGVNLYFQAKPGSAGTKGDMLFSFELDGKPDEFKRTVQVTIAEPLPIVHRKMKKFSIGQWYLHAIQSPDRALFDNDINFWKSLCERPTWSLGNADLDAKDKTRVEQLMKEFDATYLLHSAQDTIVPVHANYGFYDGGRITRPGVPKLQDENGKESFPYAICPQYLLRDPEGVYWEKNLVESMQNLLKRVPTLKNVCLDYESTPQNGTCDECRAEFARQEKLDKVPTRDEIRAGNPLYLKWRRFRERQRTQIIAKYHQTMKKHFPDINLWMCTVGLNPGQDPVMGGWSGIDPRNYAPYTDYFNNMQYSAGKKYAGVLERSIKELGKPLQPLIDPAEQDIRYYHRYTPDTVCQNILITAASGCKGIALFPTDIYDAAYLTVFCNACNAVAEAEDAYEKPAITDKLKASITNVLNISLPDGDKTKNITYPEMSSDMNTFLHNDGTYYYATLFNYSQQSDIFCRLAIPDYEGDGTVVDLLSRRKYTGITPEQIRGGFIVKLPSDGSLLLKFGPYDHVVGEVSQEQILREEQACLETLKPKAAFLEPKKKGNSAIQWVIGNTGKPVIQLKDNNATIEFSPDDGANVTDWRLPGIGHCVPGVPGKYGFGRLMFHDPNNYIPANIPFKLEKLDFNGIHPTAVMSFTVPPDTDAGGAGNPLEYLKIVRENTLMNYQGGFQIKHTFINQSKKSMNFGFRLHNVPICRLKPTDEPQAYYSNWEKVPGGIQSIIKPGAFVRWSFLGNPTNREELSIFIRIKGLPLYYKISGDYVGLYLWSDPLLQSVEPLYETFTLQPGESRTFTQDITIIDER